MIIIRTPEYREWTGGIIVLHLLAQLLKRNGEEVAFSPFGPSAFWSPYDVPQVDVAKNNDIVVYPESVRGNPLGARRRVTYYLGPCKNIRDGFALAYGEKWAFLNNLPKPWNILTIFGSKYEFFVDADAQRSGDCFTIRKAKAPQFIHRPGAVEIPRGLRNQQLLEIFQKKERFISYDFNTFLSTQAALAGCDSIVAPQRGGSQELLNKTYPPPGALGVSYGATKAPEQLSAERQCLRQYFAEIEEKQRYAVAEMFKRIKEKI